MAMSAACSLLMLSLSACQCQSQCRPPTRHHSTPAPREKPRDRQSSRAGACARGWSAGRGRGPLAGARGRGGCTGLLELALHQELDALAQHLGARIWPSRCGGGGGIYNARVWGGRGRLMPREGVLDKHVTGGRATNKGGAAQGPTASYYIEPFTLGRTAASCARHLQHTKGRGARACACAP